MRGAAAMGRSTAVVGLPCRALLSFIDLNATLLSLLFVFEPDYFHLALRESADGRGVLKGHCCSHFRFLCITQLCDLEADADVQGTIHAWFVRVGAHGDLTLVVFGEAIFEAGEVVLLDDLWYVGHLLLKGVYISFDLLAVRW